MGRLILRLFGTPEVSHAEQPLTFQTRKVLALLAYLAVEQGVHSRDKITALLWPESDEGRGKASLRRALAYLRESLDEPSHQRSRHVPLQPPHVLIEHYMLSFNTASDFEGDTQTLQTAFTLARRRSSGDPRTHLAHLQMAASCYRGNFLDGLSLPDAPDFEDWLLLQRESWRRQANTVFDRLSEWQTEAGELETALETTTRWVEHDLLNEMAYTRLMQLHSALGDRPAALHAFERCRAVLERELSAEPSSETMMLAERMRSQTSPVREPVMHEAPSPREAWEFPLTGRTAEHRALVTAFQTMRQGRMQVATIEGEPGIGQTWMARGFATRATAHLPVFLLCTCRSDDLASSVALADWLGSLERNLPVRRQALTALAFEDTLRLVQSLFGAGKGTPGDGGEGQAEKDESIEAWSKWLFAETRGHPFFLIEHLKLLADRKSLLHNEAGTVLLPPDLIMPQEAAQ